MDISLPGQTIYAYTGGKTANAQQRTVMFIHGALCDHSVWALQSRYLANHGWNVLALDLPGHGRSTGTPPATVEDAADVMARLVDTLALQQVALVGHSWGSLIALEAASRLKEKVSHLALVGISYPMAVTPSLLAMADAQPLNAIDLINQYSHSLLAPPPSGLGPGTWVKGAGRALNRRVQISNNQVNLLHHAFVACDSYRNGEQAMMRIEAKVLMILGQADQMTPAKNAKHLYQTALQSGKDIRIVEVGSGHALMTEAPDDTLRALYSFLQA